MINEKIYIWCASWYKDIQNYIIPNVSSIMLIFRIIKTFIWLEDGLFIFPLWLEFTYILSSVM